MSRSRVRQIAHCFHRSVVVQILTFKSQNKLHPIVSVIAVKVIMCNALVKALHNRVILMGDQYCYCSLFHFYFFSDYCEIQ